MTNSRKAVGRSAKLRGVVLVMVVTVMFMMIILLLATLTVVNTAQNRYFTKYEENQAYYSARSVLDVYAESLAADQGYFVTPAKTYEYGQGKTAKMTQGRALQLDWYRLPVTEGMGEDVTQDSLNAYYNSLSNGDPLKKDQYSMGKNVTSNGGGCYGVDRSAYSLNPTASNPNPHTASGIGAYYDGESKKHYYIDYVITNLPPTTINGVENKKGFGDVKDMTATLRVEVVGRTYDTAGITADYTNPQNTNQATGEAVTKGVRKSDHIRVKVTSTVIYENTVGKASIIYDTVAPPSVPTMKPTVLGNSEGANMNYYGGGSARNNMDSNNEGAAVGPMYAEGNFTVLDNGPACALEDGESFFIGGDLETKNGDSFSFKNLGTATGNLRPFLFVGGSAHLFNVNNVGTYDNIDIIVNGNLDNKNPTYGNDNKLNLGKNCNIYVKGNLDLTTAQNFGAENTNIYVEGKIFVPSEGTGQKFEHYMANLGTADAVRVNGSINGSGVTIHYKAFDWNGNSFTLATDGGGVSFVNDNPVIEIPDLADVKNPLNESDLIVKLPGGIQKNLPSHRTNFVPYYKLDENGKILATDGTLLDANGDGKPDTGKTPQIVTAAEKANKTGLRPADIGATVGYSGGNIDTSNGDVLMTFGPKTQNGYKASGQGYGNIVISGGGLCELVLVGAPEWGGTYNYDFERTNIIVEDDTTLIIYASKQDYKFMNDFNIFSRETFEKKNPSSITTILHGGDPKVDANVKVPKIQYYIEEGSNIICPNKVMLTGYIYAPGANFGTPTNKTQGPLYTYNVCYNNHDKTEIYSPSGLSFIGSILCNDLYTANGESILYIMPTEDNEDDGGKPDHTLTPGKYERG